MNSEFWNERYSKEEFAYGTNPNAFLAQEISKLSPTSILLPMDGEGRNSVFCAKLGWQVFAFDYSEEGQKKALKLAAENSVSIDFKVSDVKDFVATQKVDVVALTFTHLPPDLKPKLFEIASNYLNDNGLLIIEVYSKSQLNNTTGGPKSLDMLFSIDELDDFLIDFSEVSVWEESTEIQEGKFHNGVADVVRVLARK